MADELDGTVALVTGASSGIGAAAATSLVAEGAAVAVAARRKDRLESLAAELRQRGGTVLVLESDVTDETKPPPPSSGRWPSSAVSTRSSTTPA